ncbi:MAG: geranylgeranylglyceryl/heptaprenylglyceryl phosphate synthase [Crocinitomicaceae bacterium]|nr:geranylgeranylglyceryl/heptaprenylglyceryl phosphate synthase [Crocinitomicaceae bacterium]|tara:strand:+ start:412 stop:1143 length:732 start_codon:yes stop_codon:yes gene_type:complete
MANHWIEKLNADRLQGHKRFSVLLDPDKAPKDLTLAHWIKEINASECSDILIGGSFLSRGNASQLITNVKNHTDLPVVIFPGSPDQISEEADALLFLSLVSGRNADLLIGRHVEAAPRLMTMNIETVATAYLLVGDGPLTSAAYISQTLPIPSSKPELAVATVQAAVLLGMKAVYIDAGSGAGNPIPETLIKAVRNAVDVPLIVGGGITDFEGIEMAWNAGADLVVLGTVLEKSLNFNVLSPS